MSDSGTPRPPCSRQWIMDLTWFIGETARPMALGMVATSTAWGFLQKLDTGALGVMSALVGTLYGAKAYEKVQQAKADVEIKRIGDKP